MSCIHFKFSNTVENDKLKFEGLHISVTDLRDAIINLKNLKANLYTLKIIDAQTKKEYTDGKEMLPRNSSVVVSRVPLLNNMRVPKSKFKEPSLPQSESSTFPAFNSTRVTPLGPSGLSSEKGMLSTEELMKTADLANANATEEAKVQAMMRQSADVYAPSQYVWSPRGAGGGIGAGSASAGFHSGLKNPPPPTYICYRCGNRGHWIQMCPTNGDPNFNHYRYKRPIGTPTSQMISIDENVTGVMMDRNGQLVVRAVDLRAMRDKQIRRQKLHQASDKEPPKDDKPPPELVCKICEELIKDAVIIPCCNESYCYECIQIHLCENEFTCPACKKENVSPENLAPNKALRQSARNFQVKAAEDKSVAMASTTGFVKKTPISIITHQPVSVEVSKPVQVSNTSEVVEAEKPESSILKTSATNAESKSEEDKNIIKAPIRVISPKPVSVDVIGSPQVSRVSDKVEEKPGREEISGSGDSAVEASQEHCVSPVEDPPSAVSTAGSELGKREEERAKERRAAVEEMVAGDPVLSGEPDKEAVSMMTELPIAAAVAMPLRPAVSQTLAVPLIAPNIMLGQPLYQSPQSVLLPGAGMLTGQAGLLAGQMPPSQICVTAPPHSATNSGDPSKFDKLAAELLLNSAVSQKRAASPLCLEEFYFQQKLLKLFSKTGVRRRSTSSHSRSHSTGSYSRSSSSDSNKSFLSNSWSRSSSSSASSGYSRSRSPIRARSKAATVAASSRRSRKHRHERSKRKQERSKDRGENEMRRKGRSERKEKQAKELRREERESRRGGRGEIAERYRGEKSKRRRHSHQKGQDESLSPHEREARLERSSNRQQKQQRHHRHHKHRSGSARKSPEKKKKRMMLEAEELLDVGVSPLAGGSRGANSTPPVLSDAASISNLSVEAEEVLPGHRLRHKKRKKKQKRHQRSRHGSDDMRKKEIMNDGGGDGVVDVVNEVEVKTEWCTIPIKGQETPIKKSGAEKMTASVEVEPELGSHGRASKESFMSPSSEGNGASPQRNALSLGVKGEREGRDGASPQRNALSLGVKGEREGRDGDEEEKLTTSSVGAKVPNCIGSPSKSVQSSVLPESGTESGDKSGTKDEGKSSLANDGDTSPSLTCPEGEGEGDDGGVGVEVHGGVGVEVHGRDGEGVADVEAVEVHGGDGEGVADVEAVEVHGGDGEGVADVEEAVEIDLHADEVSSLMASVGGISMEEGNQNIPKEREEEERKEQVKASTPPPTPSPSPPPLDRSDLATILDEIDPIDDWRSLGLELRVPARKLSHIQHKFPVESLEQVLLYWITSKENCSWKYLIAALRKIKEGEVANRISKKFISRGGILGKEEGELSDSDEGTKKSGNNEYADLRDTLSSLRKDEPDLRETINSQKNAITRKRKPLEEEVDTVITSPPKRPKKSTVKVMSIASSMFSARRGQDSSGSEESIFTADDSSSSGEEEEEKITKRRKPKSSTKKHPLAPEKHSKAHDKHSRSRDKHNQLHIKNDQVHDKPDRSHSYHHHHGQSSEAGREKKRRKEKKHKHQSSTSKSHKSKKSGRLEKEERKKKYKKHKKSSSGHAERPHRSHRVH